MNIAGANILLQRIQQRHLYTIIAHAGILETLCQMKKNAIFRFQVISIWFYYIIFIPFGNDCLFICMDEERDNFRIQLVFLFLLLIGSLFLFGYFFSSPQPFSSLSPLPHLALAFCSPSSFFSLLSHFCFVLTLAFSVFLGHRKKITLSQRKSLPEECEGKFSAHIALNIAAKAMPLTHIFFTLAFASSLLIGFRPTSEWKIA